MPRWLSMILLLGLTTPMFAQDGGAQPQPVNRRAFKLPFTVDNSRGNALEIKLYVSRPGGPWELLTTAEPSRKGFEVRLSADGIYNFCPQAVYDNNRSVPATVADLTPLFRVNVDTQLPAVSLKAVAGNPGTGGVEWDCRDELIDPKGIRLECRYPGQVEWMPNPGNYNVSGSYFWQLDGKRLEVRVRARDLAGNIGESQVVSIPDGNAAAPQGNMGGGMGAAPSNPAFPNATGGGREPFYINRREVNLETRILTGKSGLSEVKLWVKREAQEWAEVPGGIREVPRGTDNANQPMPDGTRIEKKIIAYKAETDGQFGFLITSRSKVGLGEKAPRKQDQPNVQVIIDTQVPTVTLKETKVIPNGERGNFLSIQWDANDAHLAPQPVYIDYAETPAEGAPFDPKKAEWRSIAEKRDNNGSFLWPVPNAEPYRFYVRVRVLDRASNMGEAISKEPVIVDLFTPKSEILDVVPVDPGR